MCTSRHGHSLPSPRILVLGPRDWGPATTPTIPAVGCHHHGPPPHLKSISFTGRVSRIFPILQGLGFPGKVTYATLIAPRKTVEKSLGRSFGITSQTFGDGLVLSASSAIDGIPTHAVIGIKDHRDCHSDRSVNYSLPYAALAVRLPTTGVASTVHRHPCPLSSGCLFQNRFSMDSMEELLVAIPHMELPPSGMLWRRTTVGTLSSVT